MPVASTKGIVNFGFVTYIVTRNDLILHVVIVHSCSVRGVASSTRQKHRNEEQAHLKSSEALGQNSGPHPGTGRHVFTMAGTERHTSALNLQNRSCFDSRMEIS